MTPILYNMWMIVLCQSQPIDNQYCGWIGPCDPYYGCNTPSSNNHQETEKNKRFINYRSWKLHGILGSAGGEWGHAGQEFCFY